MKISYLKVKISEQDILGILTEFVKFEGLKFDTVSIKDTIKICGSFKRGITIPFCAEVGIGNVMGNIIKVKIFDVKIASFGIVRGIKNIVLKKILDSFKDIGISSEKDVLNINIDLISKLIPFVYFKINSIEINEKFITAEVSDLIYSSDKETVSPKKKKTGHKVESEDGYKIVREKIKEKTPEKYQDIVEYAMLIPDIIALLWRLLKDKRVDKKTKALICAISGYLASPIDIIPDFIPVLGEMDDVAVAFFGLDKVFSVVPKNVIMDNWQGEEDIYPKVKEGIERISKLVGSQNVAKVIQVIGSLFKKKESCENEKEGTE